MLGVHPALLEAMLAGGIKPGSVFDFETDLTTSSRGMRPIDKGRAIKSLVRVVAS